MGITEYFQPYSLLWVTGILLVAIAVVLLRSKAHPPVLVAFLSIVIGLALVYFYVRPVQTPLLSSVAQVRAIIGQGKPVLFEFQSPYCIACTSLKPAVDRAEQEYKGRLVIIRLNIQDPIAMELRSTYNFEYTPTFIFFDEQGVERWRMILEFDEAKLRAEMSKRAP
ncbi:MAG: thioredoxin family protein [Anaerolineales bacterium]